MRITVDSLALIREPDPDLVDLILRTVAAEEDLPLLRVTNPEYVSMARFGSHFGAKPPKWWVGFYKDISSYTVPRAWLELVMDSLDIEWPEVEYNLADIPAEFPVPSLTPLDHQEDAMDDFFALVNTNDKKGRPTDSCIVMNTSAGKTILGMLIAYHSSQRTLVVVPTKEIESAWVSDAVQLFGCSKKDIGQIRGKTLDVGDFLTVGSVQTLMNLDEDLWSDKFGLIILDELHMMAAKCFSRVLERSKAGLRLGLTATDNRRDGLMPVVKWHLGSNCYEDMTPRNCTELTYIGVLYKTPLPRVSPKIVLNDKKMKARKEAYQKKFIAAEMLRRKVDIDDKKGMKQIRADFKEYYSQLELPDLVRTSKESIFQTLLRQLLESVEYNNFLVELCAHIIDNYSGDVLISSSTIEHIDLLASRIESELGLTVAKLVGSTSKGRSALYEDVKKGKYRVTIGTQKIVCQGASNPRWAHVIVATPFTSPELAIQLKGRPIRLDPNDSSKIMGYMWDPVTTTVPMAKNMGKSRFRAVEPYVQHIKWIKENDII